MASKRCFGVISPQAYMEPALQKLESEWVLHRIYPGSLDAGEFEGLVRECMCSGVEAVAGFAQKDAFAHIVLNAALGNVVPSQVAFMHCMNKYLMRTLEPDPFFFAPVSPLHDTDEDIIKRIPAEEWPFMLKNTSLSLGRGIFRIESVEQLRRVLAVYRRDTKLQEEIARQYAAYLEGVPRADVPRIMPPFVAEHLVDMSRATEYCYEGYVTPEDEIVHYGLTEEVYFSNHQALGYLTPPVSISREMAGAIEEWVERYMSELVRLGYRNQFFNLEFWVMPDGQLHLTEINPRAAHSYHYNYAFSFGGDLYRDNLLLAAGERPAGPTPWELWREGAPHRYTLIVLITAREAGRVEEILDFDYVHSLQEQGVLVRTIRGATDLVTEEEISAAGVMLQQLWLTDDRFETLIAREREIRARIYRQPQDAVDYPPFWRI